MKTKYTYHTITTLHLTENKKKQETTEELKQQWITLYILL